jgi:hypothetical protein
MLNLLWDDGHACYIYKNEKNIVGTRFKGFKPFANVGPYHIPYKLLHFNFSLYAFLIMWDSSILTYKSLVENKVSWRKSLVKNKTPFKWP